MRARHLGTESNKTGCPALYATDRRTSIVQGWKVSGPETLAGLVDVRDGEFFVEIPKPVLRHPWNGVGSRMKETM